MLGGRSDEPSFLISNAQTVDGINVMQLNQMGDLVGEDRSGVQNALLILLTVTLPTTYHQTILLAA